MKNIYHTGEVTSLLRKHSISIACRAMAWLCFWTLLYAGTQTVFSQTPQGPSVSTVKTEASYSRGGSYGKFAVPAGILPAPKLGPQCMSNSSYAIDENGNLYTWGAGSRGQLARYFDQTYVPDVVGFPSGVSKWIAVSAGNSFTLAMGDDGNLYAWGDDNDGELGYGPSGFAQYTPVLIGFPSGVTSWTTMVAGQMHCMAVGNDGYLYTWGYNKSGELGIDTTASPYASPQKVSFPSGVSGWKALAAGNGFSLAIGSDGNLYATGYNNYGQLGIGSTTNDSTLQMVSRPTGVSSWTAVFAGGYHSLAIGSDGFLYSWGSNSSGQLGIGSTTFNFTTPQKVNFPGGVTSWIAVAAGWAQTLAIGNNGSLYVWGRNDYYQLGLGGTTSYNAPQKITPPAGVTSWIAVAGGYLHSLAIGNDNCAYAWGSNQNDQVGIDPSNTSAHTPVNVVGVGGTGVLALALHVAANNATGISSTQATFNGTVQVPDGASTDVKFLWGTTSGNYSDSIAADQSPVSGTSSTAVSKTVSSLATGTTCYFCVSGINADGSVRSSEKSFATLAAVLASADSATSISSTQATLNGTVQVPDGASTVVKFLWGTSSGNYTDSIAAEQSPVSGTSSTTVTKAVSSFAVDMTYYYCVSGININGYARSTEKSFSTPPASVLTVAPATGIGPTQATLNGTIQVPSGVSTIVRFLWGTSSGNYADSAAADQSPVSGTSLTSLSKLASSLTSGTTYYYRISASNTEGYTRSSELSLTAAFSNSGNALIFDGTDDYVSLSSNLWNGNFSNGTAISVEYWFKGTWLSSPYRVQDGYGYFVPGWVNNSEGNIYQIISTDGGTAGVLIGSTSTVDDNQWHHIAMTWQGNGTFTSYLDGSVVASRAVADVHLPVIDQPNYFGSYSGISEFLSGAIDEMRIWNVVRTPQEIRENMHLTLNGTESGLIGYWQFNEGSSTTTINDQTGHGYSGTLANFNFDANSGQVASTASVGLGTSSNQDNFQTGSADLGTISLTTTDDFDNPVELVCTQINSSPNVIPSSSGVNLEDRYWALAAYGTPGTYSVNLTFKVPAWYTKNGAESPTAYSLHQRDGNSDGSWTALVSGAASVTATSITFNGITSFSQFFIGSSATDLSLAVKATDFLASADVGSVTLSWKTQSEVNNAGFNVLRQDPGTASGSTSLTTGFKLISSYLSNDSLKGMGTSSTGRTYDFTDNKVTSGKTYRYKIQSVSTNGTTTDLTTLSVTVDIPKNYALYQNYPNPFNPSTTIRFDLKQQSTVTLEIYNVLGQSVEYWIYGMMDAGRYNQVLSMEKFASGVYFYRIMVTGANGEKFVSKKKLVLMK